MTWPPRCSCGPRAGFATLTEQVALGQAAIILSLEASRLARNNADWYRLLDLAGITDTLIADADAVYHPGVFDDRLLLGLKGTMAEAELHVLRARMLGGLRNKAARGELRIPLPVSDEIRGSVRVAQHEARRAGLEGASRAESLHKQRGKHRQFRGTLPPRNVAQAVVEQVIALPVSIVIFRHSPDYDGRQVGMGDVLHASERRQFPLVQ